MMLYLKNWIQNRLKSYDMFDIYLNDKLVACIPSEDEQDVIKAVEKVFYDNIEYTSYRIYKNMRILKEVKR